jgi:hypothetical protein
MDASWYGANRTTVPAEKLRQQLAQFVDAQLAGLGAAGESCRSKPSVQTETQRSCHRIRQGDGAALPTGDAAPLLLQPCSFFAVSAITRPW